MNQSPVESPTEITDPQLTREELELHALFALLGEAICDWLKTVGTEQWDAAQNEIYSVITLRDTMRNPQDRDQKVTEWIQTPKSKTWGALHKSATAYLQTRNIPVESTSLKSPTLQTNGPGAEVIETTRNPETTIQVAIQRGLQYLKKTRGSRLPREEQLVLIKSIACEIVDETFEAIRKNGTTYGLMAENTQMYKLLNTIHAAIETKNIAPILEWYNGIDAPTWGFVYLLLGQYLKLVGAIKELKPAIPAVIRESERTMLHYWMRHPNLHPDIARTIGRTRQHRSK